MNIAMVLAGGNGTRTGQDVPKQFLTVYDVPIIVYTMLNLYHSHLFDKLYVVCSDAWAEFISSYAKQYDISIFSGTISGGNTRFQSMTNGIRFLRDRGTNGKVLLSIFDGNRPMLPHDVMKNAIQEIDNCQCVVGLQPCYDSMFVFEKNTQDVNKQVDRSVLGMGQTPDVIRLEDAYDILDNTNKDISDLPLPGIMLKMNKVVHFVKGSAKSMKITTAEDFSIFKALLGETRLKTIK